MKKESNQIIESEIDSVSSDKSINMNVKSQDIKNTLEETLKTKTYYTRNVNKKYSLDTIVMDESFRNSGIYNYQGGYVKTDKSKPRTKLVRRSNAGKRLSLRSTSRISTHKIMYIFVLQFYSFKIGNLNH